MRDGFQLSGCSPPPGEKTNLQVRTTTDLHQWKVRRVGSTVDKLANGCLCALEIKLQPFLSVEPQTITGKITEFISDRSQSQMHSVKL